MLLRFRVANHRSIRDEQTLSLVTVPRRGEPKPRVSEIPPTVSVAGVYGANASGKSNLLDAMSWMLRAIQNSQTTWAPDGGVPRRPFLLSADGSGRPSFFEVDFVHEGVRHSYGFEVDDLTVTGEWLHSFPHGRPRRLFERTGPSTYEFGRALTGEVQQIAILTRENSLYLSSAASNNHPLLGGLHHHLTQRVHFAKHGDDDERSRLHATKRLLASPASASRVNRLLQVADFGITSAEIVEVDLSPKVEEIIAQFDEMTEEIRGEIQYRLKNEIRLTRSGTTTSLPIQQESAGTRVWLSMIGSTLATLDTGDVLLIDEIDSSLHPLLSSTLIRMFKDPEVNRYGAQLIFASHDTTLLGSMLDDDLLARDEVWFTEKDAAGATTLYALAEFHPRRDENIERGYLQGRYGAVPYLSYDQIRELFDERTDEPG
ncbi:AAA family ATPase [Streptosporangium lutulentum]|uniref:AAA15 family ATPase/GTPase n=1 Tax=Streptosporangium lutulentum TaxID=1461250 RepID=A0ABT9QTI0_9ACTN|nr:ATP-binding protein [Streptosporangium lutulentum]MDP9850073.1 AAA15 family ATPase/GTPase [Streptosporangium lutulentum]